MKKVLLALDSFKGSMDALTVCETIANELRGEYDTVVFPMADGGEGTVEAIVNARNGKYVSVYTVDHLGREIEAIYGIYDNTAIIEVASVCGLELVLPSERNLMISTTFGLGKVITSAIENGAENIIFAIGGTGTNDGGYGLGRALGFRFLDKNGDELASTPDSLIHLERIEPPVVDIGIHNVTIACDVKNTLCGEHGASLVYGFQKGGTLEQLEHLDKCLSNYARIIEKDLGVNVTSLEGSGAGGGIAAGLVAFCGGKLKSGYSIVSEATDVENLIKNVDVVVTGEGKTDSQTLFGKLPFGIVQSSKKYNKPVALISGCITEEGKKCFNTIGCDAMFSCVDEFTSVDDAIKNAKINLIRATKDLKTWLDDLVF